MIYVLQALWKREVIKFLRDRSRLVGALAQPVVFWLLLGLGFQKSFSFPFPWVALQNILVDDDVTTAKVPPPPLSSVFRMPTDALTRARARSCAPRCHFHANPLTSSIMIANTTTTSP